MRLTDDQIKQGIIHPEQLVRDVAVRYFSGSFSSDPTVMPLVIQAIETYGWEEAVSFPHYVSALSQTEDSILWLIDRLNRIGRPETAKDADLCFWMSSIIAKADPALLMRHEQSILELEGFTSEYQGNVAERLRLMALDTDSCWKELEVFCEGHKNDPCIDRAGLPYAERLAEAIARDESSAERVLSLLSQKNPMVWMEGLAVHVAGLIRLEAAVPMLVNKLIADRDFCLNEQCQYAFQKIGTDFAVETICKDFHAAPWHYRLYASASLERIHTDLAVSKCQELLKQELLQQEEDSSVPWNLMAGVLGGFCLEGIEPVRQLTIHGNHELRKELLGVAILMGVLFPELETLKEDAKKRDEEIARRMGLLTNGPKRKPPAPAFDHLLAPPPQVPIGKKERVGRNEPCPCGSGKKYKKCCGKNE